MSSTDRRIDDRAGSSTDVDADKDRLLEVRDLNTTFRTTEGTVHAVDGIDFSVGTGEILGVVGESGAGKSVTARSVLRLIEPPGHIDAASMQFDGDEILDMSETELRQYRGARTGMIFQDPKEALNPTMTVGDQIAEAVSAHGNAPDADHKAVEILEEVGIPDPSARADDYPHEFSGGQQQRVAVGIAIACEPDLLIADEPTTALDVTIQAQILDLLLDLRARHDMGMLYITHDLSVVREICDRVAVMYGGSIVESGPTESIYTNPRHPYTKGLLLSVPQEYGEDSASNNRYERLNVIEGTMPELIGEFDGCKYADRCPGATTECRAEHPSLEPIGDDRKVACIHHQDVEEMSYEYEHQSRDLSWISNSTKTDGVADMHVEGLKKHFGESGWLDVLFGTSDPVRAVDGIDLTIRGGETLGLVGESGCGKSTAARAILRLLEPTAGSIELRATDLTELSDEALRKLRSNVQIVFQNPGSSLNPRRTIQRTLTRPMELHGMGDATERHRRAAELVDRVGLDERHLDRYPHELSGGQKQRVAIARALSVNPELIVLDEPVSGLDVSVQAKILNLLSDLQDDLGLAYLLISHNLSVVKHVSDRIAVMYLGEIVETGTVQEVFDPPYHPYTEALLSAVPGRETEDRIILEGDVPDPSNVPSGCRFHPRCPRKIGEVCETDPPERHFDGAHEIDCHLMRQEYADEVEW